MKALGTNRNGIFGFLAHIHPPKDPKRRRGALAHSLLRWAFLRVFCGLDLHGVSFDALL